MSVKYSSLDFGLKVGFAVSKVRASLAAILSLGKIATQPDVRIRVLEASLRGCEAVGEAGAGLDCQPGSLANPI